MQRETPELVEFDSYHDLMYLKLEAFAPTLLRYDETLEISLYTLLDGRALLVPRIGGKALIYKSEQRLLEDIEQFGIPLPLPSVIVPPPFLKEQERIINITQEVPYYLSMLEEITKTGLEISTDKTYLDELSRQLNRALRSLKANAFYDKFYVPTGIYTGEVIRLIVPSEWKTERRVLINPYFTPELFDQDNKKFNIWGPLVKSVMERKKIDIVDNMRRSGIGGNQAAADFFRITRHACRLE